MQPEELNRFELFVLSLPRPVRWVAMALMFALGVALLTLPTWRRLIW